MAHTDFLLRRCRHRVEEDEVVKDSIVSAYASMNKLGLYQNVLILYKEVDGHGVTHAIIIKTSRRG